ncbi:MAG TPA: branched-chain amino acid ABC transporter permease, partial [Candidatus Binatia bacterium]|nr:branched-chain amino acid ABC transporter permease [Candidatus Binatia bacterium]
MGAGARWLGLAGAAAAVAAAPLLWPSSYVVGTLVFIGLNALAALGLSLVMGFAGQVSLGQAAFFAIGAYVSGVLSASHGWNPWASLAVAVAAGAVTAWAVGL